MYYFFHGQSIVSIVKQLEHSLNIADVEIHCRQPCCDEGIQPGRIRNRLHPKSDLGEGVETMGSAESSSNLLPIASVW